MKQQFSVYIIFFALLVTTISPAAVQAQNQVQVEDSYRASLIALISLLEKQIEVLIAELERRQTSVENTGSSITYNIQSVTELGAITNSNHRAYFSRVHELFPEEYANKVTQFRILKDSSEYFDAFIETLPPEHKTWRYSVREELTKNSGSLPNAELIIHELAHILSYESIPGKKAAKIQKCHAYFVVYGCPPDNSYMDEFIEQFWSTADLDRVQQFIQSEDMLAAARTYYVKNSTLYVTDYAAVNPEEDFAESFMFYVLGKEIAGARASEKIAFFAQYAKFAVVKSQILKNL